MIQKHELPILEYDSNSEEVIRPNHGAEQLKLPEKCVYAFLGEAVDDYAFEAEATVAETFETITRNYPVYIVKQDGMEFCLCAAPLGAPAAAQLMDFLISCGCKKIISTGSCGVLTDLAENEFLIPVKALRDEGTSYHYLPASRYIELNKNIRDAIEHTLLVQNIPFQECVTWTTDGFFRETQDMVRYRGAEGCTTVEMECAALAACARKRGASFGQILYTADSLANIYAHDERDWGRALCGKRWNSVSLCCKRFKGSIAVDNAPPQKSSDIRLRIFYLQFVQNPHKETPFLSGTIRVQSGRTTPRELLPKTCKRRQE